MTTLAYSAIKQSDQTWAIYERAGNANMGAGSYVAMNLPDYAAALRAIQAFERHYNQRALTLWDADTRAATPAQPA